MQQWTPESISGQQMMDCNTVDWITLKDESRYSAISPKATTRNFNFQLILAPPVDEHGSVSTALSQILSCWCVHFFWRRVKEICDLFFM